MALIDNLISIHSPSTVPGLRDGPSFPQAVAPRGSCDGSTRSRPLLRFGRTSAERSLVWANQDAHLSMARSSITDQNRLGCYAMSQVGRDAPRGLSLFGTGIVSRDETPEDFRRPQTVSLVGFLDDLDCIEVAAGLTRPAPDRARHRRHRTTVRAPHRHPNPLPRHQPHPALRDQNQPLTTHGLSHHVGSPGLRSTQPTPAASALSSALPGQVR